MIVFSTKARGTLTLSELNGGRQVIKGVINVGIEKIREHLRRAIKDEYKFLRENEAMKEIYESYCDGEPVEEASEESLLRVVYKIDSDGIGNVNWGGGRISGLTQALDKLK